MEKNSVALFFLRETNLISKLWASYLCYLSWVKRGNCLNIAYFDCGPDCTFSNKVSRTCPPCIVNFLFSKPFKNVTLWNYQLTGPSQDKFNGTCKFFFGCERADVTKRIFIDWKIYLCLVPQQAGYGGWKNENAKLKSSCVSRLTASVIKTRLCKGENDKYPDDKK